MRPNAAHDPSIELSEEPADVSPLVVMAPRAPVTTQELMDELNPKLRDFWEYD
jgi:hypothetical protein